MKWDISSSKELIEANVDGSVLFNEQRALILDVDLLCDLRAYIVERHGIFESSKMLWNFGFAYGLRDAGIVKKHFTRKQRWEWFKTSLEILAMRGWGKVNIISAEFEDEGADGRDYIEAEWRNSWECGCRSTSAEEEIGSCWTISGYLSGFASAVRQKDIFFFESSCAGNGSEKCIAVAKSDWTDTDEVMQELLKRISKTAPSDFNLNDALAESDPITERFRELITQLEARDSEIQKLQMQVYHLQEISDENINGEMVGKSAAYRKALSNARIAASSPDTTVLIEGETGTGKELFARYIHSQSALRKHPLITVNCAALPASLVESELFGHEKGAFTGAVQRKPGRFELAQGGTIFLDEIGELPLETQAKFLRVLQEGELERLGGTETIKVKVRVIAATNRNLEELVKEGKFRSDLYFRLNVFPVTIPSLREREGDIPLLVDFFVQKFRRHFNKPITSLSQTSIDSLKNYAFPGNIRELRHLVERAVLLSQNSTLEIDLPLQKTEFSQNSLNSSGELKTFEEMERDYIQLVLLKTSGVIAGKGGAAEILDLPPSTLRSRMKKLGIR